MHADDDKTWTYVALESGTMVSHYRIIEKIGPGGMGEVYLAEDTKLDRKVALKFLPQHLCLNADCRARFTREAQASAKLDHPNIVAVFEVGEYNGRPFFSMQHVEGQTLKEVIAGKPLPMDRIIELGIQMCEGLQAAHEKGITHRDIKPSNILIDSHGRARIVDFGLASVLGADQLTKTGSTLGTIGYMSPEQVRGDKVDHRTDLFSFGVVLYEAITGHSPFKADSEAATLHAITNTKPDLLARYRREVPAEIQTIIDKALEKDVATRYQHADDIATDLKRLASPSNTQSVPRRDLWNRYVVTAAAVVLLVSAGYWLITDHSSPKIASADLQRKVLAVLPFKNMSPDPDQDYFSDGMTEELTSRLSMVQSLCVISRSSSMTFKGSNKTIPEIARELGAQYVVEGSVRREGKELRITAQLIDASKDSHLWADSYTGTVNDVFDMQDSVTRAIVNGVRIHLSPNETRRLNKRSFNSPLAYEYYLRFKDFLQKGTESDDRRGIQYLEQGADIVGDNALIMSGMAWGYWAMVNGGYAQDEYVVKAEAYAQKAIDLDPDQAEAHAMLGWINSTFLGNQRKAIQHFKDALAIDPNSILSLDGLSVVYYEYVGKQSAAIPLVRRRALLAPLDSIFAQSTEGDLWFFDGDFRLTVAPYRRVVEEGSKGPVTALFCAMVLAYCDSTNEAIAVIDECVKANPTSSVSGISQIMKCALRNDRKNALQALTPEVRLTCRRDAAWSYELGAILARAGAKEEAYDWLDNAVDRGNINFPFMQKDPFLNNLRGEDRFRRLMERVKSEWEHFEA